MREAIVMGWCDGHSDRGRRWPECDLGNGKEDVAMNSHQKANEQLHFPSIVKHLSLISIGVGATYFDSQALISRIDPGYVGLQRRRKPGKAWLFPIFPPKARVEKVYGRERKLKMLK